MKIRDFYPPLKSNLHPLIMQQGLKTLHPSQHITPFHASHGLLEKLFVGCQAAPERVGKKIPMIPQLAVFLYRCGSC